MKPKKQPKKQKKFAYYQSCGQYSNDILVCVGMDADDTIKFCKRTGGDRAIPLIEKHKDFINDLIKDGGTPQLQDGGACIIFFKAWSFTWEQIDTLTHELYHAVDHISRRKEFRDEGENCAYLLEYLHREIRRRLNRKYGIK